MMHHPFPPPSSKNQPFAMMSTSTVQHGETSPLPALPPCKGAVRSVEAKAFGNAIVDRFVSTDLQ